MKHLLLAGIISGIIASCFAQTSATLSVTADGTQPFSYSWKKDGATIAGATGPSLLLSPLATSQTGVYAATVLNAAGSATAPANVIILGSSTTAPATGIDYGKFTVQAGLPTPWTPPVGQWEPAKGGFAIAPVKKSYDPGNHWDDASSAYTVGAGEDGFYEIHMNARLADAPTPYTEIGITAGIDNLDNATKFDKSPGPDAGYVHFTVEHTVWRNLKAGQKLHVNLYTSTAAQVTGFDVTITRRP